MKLGAWKLYWPVIVYASIVALAHIAIGVLVYQIISVRFPNQVIALRFNIFEGVTVIENSIHVLRYVWISLGITTINSLLFFWCRRVQWPSKQLRRLLIHWICLTTIAVLGLVAYYLLLVIRINS